MPDDPKELREKAVALELQAKAAEALAAQQAEALPPAAAAPAAPEIPAAPLVPAPVAAAEAQLGPRPPAGKAPLQTIDEWEALPEPEQLDRMPELDVLLRGGQQ